MSGMGKTDQRDLWKYVAGTDVWVSASFPNNPWTDGGVKLNTTSSVAIGAGGIYADSIGTDVYFFVSGSRGVTSGANRKMGVFGGDVLGSGTITATSGLSGSLTRLADGQAYMTSSGVVTISSASNGAITIGSLMNMWFPDAAPVSASAEDDEFTGTSLSANWTVWNVPGTTTASIDTVRRMLKLINTGSAVASSFAGVFRAVPASNEYAIYSKCSIVSAISTAAVAGIFVAENLATIPSTARFHSIEIADQAVGSVTQMITRDWSKASNGAATNTVTRPENVHYMRIRISGTTCASDISSNGIEWIMLQTETLAYTPVSFGALCLNSAGVTSLNLFDFFRVQSGVGTSQISGTFLAGAYL